MVTLSWIVHTGYLLWKPQQNMTNPNLTEATILDQVQGTTLKKGTGKVVPGHNLIFTGITAQVIMMHTEAAAMTGVAHDSHNPHI